MIIKNKISIKRVLLGVAAGGFFTALAFAYFFFPATARHVLKSTAAVVVASWDDTFGGTNGGYASVIDLTGGTSSVTDAQLVGGAPPADGLADSRDAVTTAGDAGTTAASTTQSDVAPDDSAPNEDTPETNTAVTITTTTAQCAVAASAALSRKLIFNEVAWMGSPPLAGETASAAADREWMELKNISGAAMDISHWQVLDAAGKIKVIFDTGTSVPAGGLLLLARGDDAVPGVTVDKTYSGALSNAGGVLAIFDDTCNASDVLDASGGWPAGNNATKQTLERDADGDGWHTSAAPGGTPKAENSVAARPVATTTASTVVVAVSTGNVAATTTTATTTTVTATTTATSTDSAAATTTVATTTATSTAQTCASAPDHLVIAEVQIAGTASGTSANDFIKIFNPTAISVDVGGWKLRKKSKSGADYSLRVFPDGNAVAPGGYFTWANSGDGFGDVAGANVTSTETLAADNSVALLDASGTIVDAVAWGEGVNQYGEGAAYPTNPEAGQVLTRKSTNGVMVDTNNNADDFAL